MCANCFARMDSRFRSEFCELLRESKPTHRTAARMRVVRICRGSMSSCLRVCGQLPGSHSRARCKLSQKTELMAPPKLPGTSYKARTASRRAYIPVASKVAIVFLERRLQRVLRDIATMDHQFGGAFGRGTTDALFLLKVTLQKRKAAGIDTWVARAYVHHRSSHTH